jgi:hypothetical protein
MGRKKSFLLFLFFVALFVVGLNIGEADSVYQKAVTICLSCIGIG